jgi:hypothetical protein
MLGMGVWKELIDYKYRTKNPNILFCSDVGASNFWQGVMWAARVAKMGYRWKVGNGSKIRFWEDVWLGSSSLVIQYWEVYSVVNGQNRTIREIWDGTNLKCTFRRRVDRRVFDLWEVVCVIAENLVLSGEDDELIWQFQSSMLYSSHSLYSEINFRGVVPVFIPTI